LQKKETAGYRFQVKEAVAPWRHPVPGTEGVTRKVSPKTLGRSETDLALGEREFTASSPGISHSRRVDYDGGLIANNRAGNGEGEREHC